MKKLATIVFLLFFTLSFKALAQDNLLGAINYDLLEKYIQAAKDNYIKRKIMGKRVEIANTARPVAALSYLDIVNISYFYRPNDNTVLTTPGTINANPYSVNGVQLSFGISLGQFFEKPFVIKQAKLNYQMAQLEAQDFDKTIETEVKTRYYDYIQQTAQRKIISENLQQITLIADGQKTKFENSQVSLDAYDQSILSLSAAKSAQISAEIAFLKSQDALEEIIGKKLTEIK
jgi:outer membrane protein TolC